MRRAIEEVARARSSARSPGRTLVAHNAAFERHFLARYVSPSLARRALPRHAGAAGARASRRAGPAPRDGQPSGCFGRARRPPRARRRARHRAAALAGRRRRARRRSRATRPCATRSSAMRRARRGSRCCAAATRCRPRRRGAAQYIAIRPSARGAGALRRRRDRRGARRRGARPALLPAATACARGRSAWRASSCACSTRAGACCSRAARASASRSPISRR